MRTGIALVTAAVLFPWSGAALAAPPDAVRVAVPPRSLAAYYPPEADYKVYTHEMLELGRLMGTLATDLGKDSATVGLSLTAFIAQLDRVAEMVPEWSHRFPDPGLDDLVTDADSDAGRAAIEAALEEVSESCTACHVTDLFPVQAKHHWPAFSDVLPEDAEGQAVPFHVTMIELSNRMAALPVDVERGRWENAADDHGELTRQFDLLEKSCTHCHEEPRAYFVDESIRGIILFAGGMVRVRNADASEYQEKMQSIEARSCIPCHQIHMPAAYMQMQLHSEGGP